MIRKCFICGAPFPEDAPAAKKYCKKCGVIRNRELTRLRQQKREKQRAEKQRLLEQQTTSLEDRAYCQKCIYHPKHTENYLCNYIVYTGVRRQCKAGVGCTKRVLIRG